MNIELPVVVYDACVLYPALLRDFLIQLGLAKCLLPKWSRRIQEEWKRNLLKNRLDLSRSTLDRTTRLMEAAIPSALVEPPEELIASLELPPCACDSDSEQSQHNYDFQYERFSRVGIEPFSCSCPASRRDCG